MLNEVQKKAFEKGFSLYQEYCLYEDKKCDLALDKLEEALEVLGKYMDEVYNKKELAIDDLLYLIIFANVVQDMQKSGEFTLTEECLPAKLRIHIRTIQWFNELEDYFCKYKGFIWAVFNDLGWELVSGKELKQNDDVARSCFAWNKKLSQPFADVFLNYFERNTDGKWVYTGDRPQ